MALVAGTIFSAISGSTIATTAMLGSLLLPQMLQRNYEPKTAMGPILAIGGVDILIPPSGLAVLLGSLAGISISGLLIGGIVPGLILSALFIGYVLMRCWLNPSLAPAYDDGQPAVAESLAQSRRHRPAADRSVRHRRRQHDRRLGNADGIERDRRGGDRAAGGLLWLPDPAKIFGSRCSARCRFPARSCSSSSARRPSRSFSSFSGATAGLVALIEGSQFSQMTILIGMLAVLLILGFFIDQTSIMMITLPFYMPLLRNMGVDLIWFGILYLLCMQIGLLTPPFGLLLFVLKGVAPPGISIGMIYRAAIPYVWLTMLMMALIFVIPCIVTAFVPS